MIEMPKSTPPLDDDENKPDAERRNFLKNAARLGAFAALIAQAPKAALVDDITAGNKNIENLFETYPTIPLPSAIGGTLTFHGASHDIETGKARFDEIVQAVRSCDAILIEYAVLPLTDEFRELVTVDDVEFKERVMAADDKTISWFKLVTLLAARNGKPVIGTDPGTGIFDGAKLKSIDRAALFAEYPSLVAAVGGVTLAELSKDVSRREALLKFLALPALAIHGASRAIEADMVARGAEAVYAPKTLQQVSMGKAIAEISVYNYRDFGSVAGLYALAKVAPEFFKGKNIGAFYGAAHFPVMQISTFPEEVISGKLSLYRRIDPSLQRPPAEIGIYDPNAENPISEKPGNWKVITAEY